MSMAILVLFARAHTSTTDKNIEAVKKRILYNLRNTMREVTDDVGISFGSCQAIFMNVLGIKRVVAKIVQELLNFDQKQRRIDIAQQMLTTFNDNLDLVTNNGCISMTLKPKKTRQVQLNAKVLLTVFFDCNGVNS